MIYGRFSLPLPKVTPRDYPEYTAIRRKMQEKQIIPLQFSNSVPVRRRTRLADRTDFANPLLNRFGVLSCPPIWLLGAKKIKPLLHGLDKLRRDLTVCMGQSGLRVIDSLTESTYFRLRRGKC